MSWDSDLDHDAWLNGRFERPDQTCADCGEGFWSVDVATLCNACLDRRDAHADALELRMAKADVKMSTTALHPVSVVVDVALVPISGNPDNPVVEVALVPTTDARHLRRMAQAILAADLTRVKDVA
jgi:hypothetical protein